MIDDQTSFVSLFSALNKAALNDDGWDFALGLVAEQFGAQAAEWEQISLVPGGAARTHGYAGFEDKMLDEYIAHYYRLNPRLEKARAAPVGVAQIDDDFITATDRRRSSYFDWLQHSTDHVYCMFVKTRHDRETLTALGLHREEVGRTFTSAERAALEELVPYLQMVEATSDEIRRLQGKHAVTSAFFEELHSGVAYLDRHGRISATNAAFTIGLDTGDFLSITASGQLLARARQGQAGLDRAIAGAVTGEIQAVPLRSAAGDIRILRIVPLSIDHPLRSSSADIAILFLQDLQTSHRSKTVLHSSFGLTRREADIALLIATNHSVREIADKLQLAVPTVRVHLRSIFAKTETRRQSEVATLILKLIGEI